MLQIRKAHSHMVKAYEGKLSEYVIPVEELGFDPLVPNNVEWHIYRYKFKTFKCKLYNYN